VVPGEPAAGTPGARDVDGDGKEDARRDRQADGEGARQPASLGDGDHRR
jgi:hypothetical protein